MVTEIERRVLLAISAPGSSALARFEVEPRKILKCLIVSGTTLTLRVGRALAAVEPGCCARFQHRAVGLVVMLANVSWPQSP